MGTTGRPGSSCRSGCSTPSTSASSRGTCRRTGRGSGPSPPWAGIPVVVMFGLLTANMIQNLGSIGIRPKRFTPEWQSATKERERAENTNPVTRYLDRRREERGWQFMPSDYYPTHPYFMWMKNSHDWDACAP